jgi:hypothetical protein
MHPIQRNLVIRATNPNLDRRLHNGHEQTVGHLRLEVLPRHRDRHTCILGTNAQWVEYNNTRMGRALLHITCFGQQRSRDRRIDRHCIPEAMIGRASLVWAWPPARPAASAIASGAWSHISEGPILYPRTENLPGAARRPLPGRGRDPHAEPADAATALLAAIGRGSESRRPPQGCGFAPWGRSEVSGQDCPRGQAPVEGPR